MSWDELLASISSCGRCRLCESRKNVVPGEGDVHAGVMFIGEGPGANEDEQGRPFVGAAGELLTRMIESIGLDRQACYIANIVKCRPPRNRAPEADEAEACLPFLRAQVSLVRPLVIVLLGATALRFTLGADYRITRDRGRFVERAGVFMMPTFHPAALLRDPSKKRPAWEDFKAVRDRLYLLRQSQSTD